MTDKPSGFTPGLWGSIIYIYTHIILYNMHNIPYMWHSIRDFHQFRWYREVVSKIFTIRPPRPAEPNFAALGGSNADGPKPRLAPSQVLRINGSVSCKSEPPAATIHGLRQISTIEFLEKSPTFFERGGWVDSHEFSEHVGTIVIVPPWPPDAAGWFVM